MKTQPDTTIPDFVREQADVRELYISHADFGEIRPTDLQVVWEERMQELINMMDQDIRLHELILNYSLQGTEHNPVHEGLPLDFLGYLNDYGYPLDSLFPQEEVDPEMYNLIVKVLTAKPIDPALIKNGIADVRQVEEPVHSWHQITNHPFHKRDAESQFRQKIKDRDYLAHGLTYPEKSLYLLRQSFARSIKLVLLAAELKSIATSELRTKGILRLPSDIRITVNSSAISEEDMSELFNPTNWAGLNTMEGRAVALTTRNSSYVIKFIKDPSYNNVILQDDYQNLSTDEEFSVGRSIQQKGSSQIHRNIRTQSGLTQFEEVAVRSEIPVAKVVFPDGLGLVVYRFEQGLLNNYQAHKELVNLLTKNIDRYRPLLTKVAEIATAIANTGKSDFDLSLVTPTENDLIAAYAIFMMQEAAVLAEQKQLRLGYRQTDSTEENGNSHSGYLITESENGFVTLTQVSFDFEYYVPIPVETMGYLTERQWETAISRMKKLTDWATRFQKKDLQELDDKALEVIRRDIAYMSFVKYFEYDLFMPRY